MARIVIDGTGAETARTVLVAAFAAVGLVLLGAVGLHKLKARGVSVDLPGSLGANITQTADGFAYSQSERGHTVFTIHASSITQFKGSQAELHHVDITLYGPQGSNRKDHISGENFVYDKAAGEVSARGKVVIDMAAPGAAGAADTIHVETSGLRYSQKTGRAVTADPLLFAVPRAGGRAVGGTYDAHTGVLVLESAIELHAVENGMPALTQASHAEISRDAHAAYLLNVRSRFNGMEMAADQAILHFRPDGTLQHLDAENRVSVLTAEGAHLHATNASVDLDGHSQPLTAYAGGGVNYHAATGELETHGNAVESTLSFAPGPDGKQLLHHAQFRNAVSFVLQQNSLAGDPRGIATREITATKIDIAFAPSNGGRSEAQTAAAEGTAKVDLHDLPFGAPQRHSTIYADKLTANLRGGRELQQLDGSGGTKFVDYAPDGSFQSGVGNTLHVAFLPEAAAHEHTAGSGGRKAPNGAESAVLASAEQRGGVVLTAQPARDARTSTGTPQQPFFAEGGKAVYQAADSTLRLTGDPEHPPRVHNDAASLTANPVDVPRNAGVATARGDVRATLLQKPAPGSKQPKPGLGGAGAVHVTGSSATVARATDTVTFLGEAGVPARIWQGANSVSAPVLEFTKGGAMLDARGPEGVRGAVRSVFSGQGVTRITSDGLFYADSTRSATFRGPVFAEQPSGEFRADGAQLFLSEVGPGDASRLERMVAAGHVVLTEPNRRGTGEKLVYTAADGSFLLTGGARAADAEHGTVAGAQLLFKPGENFVEVLGGEGAGRRTVTDTRTPN